MFGNEPNSANSNTAPHAGVSARHRVGVRPKAVDLHLAQGGCAVPTNHVIVEGTKTRAVIDVPLSAYGFKPANHHWMQS